MIKNKKNYDETVNYHNKLEEWTAKEMQLNMLHEEIINRREALLRTCRNMLHDRQPDDVLPNDTDASLRSDRMMKDFAALQESLDDGLNAEKSPRLTTLQANYWSMVSNTYPLWERALVDDIPTRDPDTQPGNMGRDTQQWSSLAHV